MFLTLSKGTTIFYRIEGSGIPILMLHGFAADTHLLFGCMEPIFQDTSLDHHFQRIYFDLPGHGKSNAPDWISSADDIIFIIKEFITKVIGLNPFILTAQSYGAYLGKNLLNHYKNQITRALFICPVVVPLHANRDRPKLTILQNNKPLLDSLPEYERKKYTSITVLQSKYTWDRYQNDFLPGIYNCNRDLFQRVRKNYALIIDPFQPPVAFPNPVLIFLGHQDNVVGFSDQLTRIDQFPHGSIVLLDRAGHNLPAEQLGLFQNISSLFFSDFLQDSQITKN